MCECSTQACECDRPGARQNGMSDNVQINSELANRKRLRRAWSRGALADAAGLSRRTVGRALAGEDVSVGTARQLAAALDIPTGKLIVVTEESEQRGAACA